MVLGSPALPYPCHAASPWHTGTGPPLSPSQPRCRGKRSYHLSGTRQRSSPGPADGLGWAACHRCAVTGLGAHGGQRARERRLPKGSQFPLPGTGSEAAGMGLGRGARVQSSGTEEMLQSSLGSVHHCPRTVTEAANWSLFGKSHHHHQHMRSGLGRWGAGSATPTHLLSLSHPALSLRREGLAAGRELA